MVIKEVEAGRVRGGLKSLIPYHVTVRLTLLSLFLDVFVSFSASADVAGRIWSLASLTLRSLLLDLGLLSHPTSVS